MMKYFAVAFSLLLLLLAQTSSLQAQPGCPHFSPDYLVERFPYVFVGKVLEKKEQKDFKNSLSVQVLENFKGMENQTSTILYKVADGCGGDFSVGKTYLFVANKDENGILAAWSYNAWENEREYIDILRWKKSLPKTGFIVGTVLARNRLYPYDSQKPSNIQKVYLKNEKGKISVTNIESDGHYKFDKLPTGKYTVYLELPKGLKTSFMGEPIFKDFKVDTKNGLLLNFDLLYDNSIGGRVVNAANQPINSMRLLLLTKDSSGNEIGIDRTKTDEEGKYEFKELPIGNYVVLTYPFLEKKDFYDNKNPFDAKSKYAPTYFSTSLQRSDAKTIDLKTGERFSEANINVKDAVIRKISGQVIYPDETPAKDIEITLHVFKKLTSQVILRNDTYEVITLTDTNGNFSFEGTEDTKYIIQAIDRTAYKNMGRLRSDCIELNSKGDIKLLKIMLLNRHQGCYGSGIDYSK